MTEWGKRVAIDIQSCSTNLQPCRLLSASSRQVGYFAGNETDPHPMHPRFCPAGATNDRSAPAGSRHTSTQQDKSQLPDGIEVYKQVALGTSAPLKLWFPLASKLRDK